MVVFLWILLLLSSPILSSQKERKEDLVEDEIVDVVEERLGPHGHSHDHSHILKQELKPEELKKYRERLHKLWDDDDDDNEDDKKNVASNVWLYAITSTLIISAAPFIFLFFIPIDDSKEKQWILKILLGFASGGLIGDAFLHLIPHAIIASSNNVEVHNNSHNHSHSGSDDPHNMIVGLGVVFGIIAFLGVEKFVRIIKGEHNPKINYLQEKENHICKNEDTRLKKNNDKKRESGTERNPIKEDKSTIKVAGYLNLAADFFHNFTDGLAIGASFYAGDSIGFITTFTILLHEVPHEIGDFAILIQSGVPRMKAIFLQLITAIGALLGCVISLYAGGGAGDAASLYILPFTAGGFIYIATVSIIPELLEETGLKQSFMEILSMFFGVFMMVLIAKYE